MIHSNYFTARYSVEYFNPTNHPMETAVLPEIEKLNTYILERQQVANELQNEVNQLLASVLLWIRFAKTENKLMDDLSIMNAEKNLQEAINRVRHLHYALAEETDDVL